MAAASHPVGTPVPVEEDDAGAGAGVVTVPPLGPSEVLVLTNRPDPDEGAVAPS